MHRVLHNYLTTKKITNIVQFENYYKFLFKKNYNKVKKNNSKTICLAVL